MDSISQSTGASSLSGVITAETDTPSQWMSTFGEGFFSFYVPTGILDSQPAPYGLLLVINHTNKQMAQIFVSVGGKLFTRAANTHSGEWRAWKEYAEASS